MIYPWNTNPLEKVWRDKSENSICYAFVDLVYDFQKKTNTDFTFYHIENERKCSFNQGHKRKRMGVLAGVLDYHIIWPNRQAYIEIKAGYNKPTESQLEYMERLDRYGIPYGVARTPNQAFDMLRGFVCS